MLEILDCLCYDSVEVIYMPSEKQKQYRNKWDSEHMKLVACKIRRDIAEDFAVACRANGTNPNAVLHDCILQYLSDNRDSGLVAETSDVAPDISP